MLSALLSCEVLGFVITLAVAFFLFTRLKINPGLPLPPGPKKLPLIGNLLSFPSSFEWETFQAWGKQYNSPIVHASVAGRSLIILNTMEAARDLMEKRSLIYSGRPNLRIVNDFMGFGWLFVFMSYTPEWKERRRVFARHFHPNDTAIHKGKILQWTRRLLYQLINSPESYMKHVRHAVGGTLVSVAYGRETQPINDPYINIAEEVMEHLADTAITATMIIDFVPFLLPILSRILPVSSFSKSPSQWKRLAYQFRDAPFNQVQKALIEGTAEPSFVSRALEADSELSKDTKLYHEIVKDVAAIVFIGGSGTVNAIVHTFFLAMLLFPEAQQKAQEELDTIVGRGRLPEFNDQTRLPYLNALVKEVQRWRPGGPLAIPHFLESDDEYNGYRIPGQSIILANVWAMLHDEEMYPNPDTFKPERFLKQDGTPNPSVRDPATVAFGFGRRICPGVYIADFTLWIIAASILSSFKISRATDENGNEIVPTGEYRSAVTFAPLPFKCKIEPRHGNVKTLIHAAME